ncbi:hypothetical protein HDV01_001011 [Terramyces sp. JEL0728]|nr:hypothetical protein HDV01_001011 [Terramyces sp. JEL0728]
MSRLQVGEQRSIFNFWKSAPKTHAIPPNPKGFFANERTFLHWLNLILVLGSLGIGLVNFGDTFAQISGLVFVVVAFYALVQYHIRADLLERKEKGVSYEDMIGALLMRQKLNRIYEKKVDVDVEAIKAKYSKATELPSAQNIAAPKEEMHASDIQPKTTRQYWYSDPFQLSEAIKAKSNDEQLIVNLIKNHTGASNAEVFGTAFAELSRNNHHQLVLDLYEVMEKRKIKLTEKGFTSLINSYAVIGNENGLKKAFSLFEDTEKSDIQYNVMLKYCLRFGKSSGYDMAMNLYQDMTKNEGDKKKTPKQLDSTTVSLLMRTCIKKSTKESIELAMALYKMAKPDEKTFIAYVQLATKLKMHSALGAIENNYGLGERRGQFKLTTESLTQLMYYASAIKYPALGQKWYEKHKDLADSVTTSALASLYIQSKLYPSAFEIIQKTNNASLGIRLCADATKDGNKDYLEYAHSLYDKDLDIKDMYNYFLILKNTKSSYKKLIDDGLLDRLRKDLEEYITKRIFKIQVQINMVDNLKPEGKGIERELVEIKINELKKLVEIAKTRGNQERGKSNHGYKIAATEISKQAPRKFSGGYKVSRSSK